MSGVKGRSGRRTTSEESKRRQAIQKAWEIVWNILKPAKVTQYGKAVAKEIALKDLGRHLEHSGEGMDTKIIIVRESKEGANEGTKDRIQTNQEARPGV